jgi:hypothetical protein
MGGDHLQVHTMFSTFCIDIFLKIEDFESESSYIQTNAILLVVEIQYAQQFPSF